MEQQPGAINWTEDNPPVPDGQVTQWLQDAAVDGIERVMMFRWRATLWGGEQYHTGLLRHDASKDRAFHEVAAFEPPPLPPPAQVALLYDYEDAWAIEIEPHQAGLSHRDFVVAAHAAACGGGHSVDVVLPGDDVAGYGMLLIVAAQLATEAKLAQVRTMLDAGGTVILGPRSFTRTTESTASTDSVPLGLVPGTASRIIEGLSQTMDVRLEPWGVAAGSWTDVFDDSADGEVLATYGGGTHLDASAAVVRHRIGDGTLIQLGASSAEAWKALFEILQL